MVVWQCSGMPIGQQQLYIHSWAVVPHSVPTQCAPLIPRTPPDLSSSHLNSPPPHGMFTVSCPPLHGMPMCHANMTNRWANLRSILILFAPSLRFVCRYYTGWCDIACFAWLGYGIMLADITLANITLANVTLALHDCARGAPLGCCNAMHLAARLLLERSSMGISASAYMCLPRVVCGMRGCDV